MLVWCFFCAVGLCTLLLLQASAARAYAGLGRYYTAFFSVSTYRSSRVCYQATMLFVLCVPQVHSVQLHVLLFDQMLWFCTSLTPSHHWIGLCLSRFGCTARLLLGPSQYRRTLCTPCEAVSEQVAAQACEAAWRTLQMSEKASCVGKRAALAWYSCISSRGLEKILRHGRTRAQICNVTCQRGRTIVTRAP